MPIAIAISIAMGGDSVFCFEPFFLGLEYWIFSFCLVSRSTWTLDIGYSP